MNHAARSFLLALSLMLTVGCCGPMWNHGGCAGACSGGGSGGCGACEGCGELYIDPWINEPADCHDPCDSCGNFNGQSCGKCRPIFAGVKSLWGYRCDDGCSSGCDGGCGGGCSDGGCDSGSCGGGDCGCGGHGSVHTSAQYAGGYSDGEPTYALGDGETIVESRISGQPTPARSGNVQSRSAARISQQSGTSRPIFQPRRVDQSRSLAY